MGKGSTGDEREMAKRIAQISDPDPEIVYEGQEKADFWSLLGGKGSYTDERVLKNVGEATTPRLFHGSNASGTFKSKLQRVKKNIFLLFTQCDKMELYGSKGWICEFNPYAQFHLPSINILTAASPHSDVAQKVSDQFLSRILL